MPEKDGSKAEARSTTLAGAPSVGPARRKTALDRPPSEWFRFRLSTLMLLPLALALLGAWRGREMALYIPVVLYFALVWNWARSVPRIGFAEAILRGLRFIVTGISGTIAGCAGAGVMVVVLISAESLLFAARPNRVLFAGLLVFAMLIGYYVAGVARSSWIYCARWAFPAAWLALMSGHVWSRRQPIGPEWQVVISTVAWIVAATLFGVGCLADYCRWRRPQLTPADRRRERR